ncbi:ABC transporter [Carpediemonas membranifera]|uniref:ABC transporter n=1 Tax=Carpediemonas membranifera TaxID=201153 RepID=A0A8J6B6H4_9EUKA|nr:ABC transporter [Carpediemonas membranifera]|eukprot:KAG9391002.1 ABC transporter [Carpediemonas membranifera]
MQHPSHRNEGHMTRPSTAYASTSRNVGSRPSGSSFKNERPISRQQPPMVDGGRDHRQIGNQGRRMQSHGAGEEEYMDITRVPCEFCGRKFAEDRIERHMNTCAKRTDKKRQVFDSSKQRQTSEDADDKPTKPKPAQRRPASAGPRPTRQAKPPRPEPERTETRQSPPLPAQRQTTSPPIPTLMGKARGPSPMQLDDSPPRHPQRPAHEERAPSRPVEQRQARPVVAQRPRVAAAPLQPEYTERPTGPMTFCPFCGVRFVEFADSTAIRLTNPISRKLGTPLRMQPNDYYQTVAVDNLAPDDSYRPVDESAVPADASVLLTRRSQSPLKVIAVHIVTWPLLIGFQLVVMMYKSMLQWVSSIISIVVKNVIIPFLIVALVAIGIRSAVNNGSLAGDTGLMTGGFPHCTAGPSGQCVSLIVCMEEEARSYGLEILQNFLDNNDMTYGNWTPSYAPIPKGFDVLVAHNYSTVDDWIGRNLNVTPAVVIVDTLDPTERLVTYQAFFNASAISTMAGNALRSINNVKAPLVAEMSRALAQWYRGEPVSRIDVTFVEQPMNLGNEDMTAQISKQVNGTFLPMLVFAVLANTFIGVLNDLVFDRTNHIKESLVLMGLKDSVYWMHKYIAEFASALLIAGLFFGADHLFKSNMFPNANFGPVVFCTVAFMEAFNGQAHLVSLVVRRAKTAAILGFGIYISQMLGIFVCSILVRVGIIFVAGKYLAIPLFFIFPNLALAHVLFIVQKSYPGLSFDRFDLHAMWDVPRPVLAPDKGLDAMSAVITMYAAAVFFRVVAWYLYHVFPPGDESRKPWYFPIAPSWLFGIRSGTMIVTDESSVVASDLDPSIQAETTRALTEDVGLRIMKLSKTFRVGFGGSTRALDDLCLTADDRSCLVLLGHNGAGKSTCVNMLDGLTEPTSGDALMYGKSIVSEPESIRRMIGVVQQHDMTFKGVSGLQHVILAGLLQRTPHVYRRAREVIDLVGLTKARNRDASNYSGGMKRRLMLAMAIVHNPRILFVDEVTSGMDPLNRRNVWAILKDIKAQGRIVVLTTHSMEEADMLGDKVAILANGRLRAVGSVLDLKQRFGSGYKISLVPKEREHVTEADRADIESLFARELSARPVPGAGITFAIPNAIPAEVSRFLKLLETSIAGDGPAAKTLQHIASYGIAHSSLGEVFMQVTTGKGRGSGSASTGIEDATRLPDGRFQIRVRPVGSSVELGFVTVAGKDTLADLRTTIKVQLPDLQFADDDIAFFIHGAAVSRAQEEQMTAVSAGSVLELESRREWVARMAALFTRMLEDGE